LRFGVSGFWLLVYSGEFDRLTPVSVRVSGVGLMIYGLDNDYLM